MHVIVNHLITVAMQAGPMILLGLIVWLASGRRDVAWPWLLVAIGLILVEDLLLTGIWLLVPQPEEWGQWNWTGKALALAGTLVIASLKTFGLDAVGLRLYQEPGSGRAWLAAIVAVAALTAAVFLVGGNPYQGTDTLLFQTLLVAPEEEFFYRGTLFLVLDRAFLERRDVYGASIGPAVLLTALYFATVHGLVRSATGVEFRPPLFAGTLAAGLFLGWLRAKTGSLLAPTLTRAASNAVLATF